MVVRVSMMLLAVQDMQDANHIPMGMMLLYVGVGYLPHWEYYQNNWGWGCAESGWGCTWAFNQLTWWDYNAYFRDPPPESCNWFDIKSSDAHTMYRRDTVPGFWPLLLRLLLVSALWGCCSPRRPRNHTASTSQECFLRQMKHTDSYLSHCFLSLSPSLLIYLSFSLWCRSNCSLFPTPLPQHCCCCCCW